MKKPTIVSGFSKLSKRGKIRWLVENFFTNPEEVARELKSFWYGDPQKQKIFDDFSENTVSNFYLPYGVVPNLEINGKLYCVPMVIEESSVVAAASAASKFWLKRGGFKAEIIATHKIGQVHFDWKGDYTKLHALFPIIKKRIHDDTAHITSNMRERGGGISNIELVDMTHLEDNYYQLKMTFETCDSMGANFINSTLEEASRSLRAFVNEEPTLVGTEKELTIIMAILSNYTPECLVRAWVECPVDELGTFDNGNMDSATFAYKFDKALKIAHIDVHRATTHNKGIFNGIDAVALATGNDFRAIESCGHTYAARDGKYKSLSSATIENGIFKFWLDIPLAIGTVGGLTSLHPLAKRSLEMLGNPSAEELMMVIAATGLAQNFAAVRSLVTTGIQQGHMKMHLMNILNHLEASEKEVILVLSHFKDKLVSFTAVRDFLNLLRNNASPELKMK
ncbi:hydroxymethylglutaryl-CoA reductase [Aureispira anguillae]|uniref:Hydroxymethylglutaryl-CoA reductase n=1 Tax=Aureispira anguillae TaxID=2864201 RepID=A0A916DUC2_9BACT|nr:hydroxymethylglutaryl-CoA reductase [Aureispira anguillae]BDS14019.1 hydroxymethylglutaryl-CoA reductase [Aureispira anguillae]